MRTSLPVRFCVRSAWLRSRIWSGDGGAGNLAAVSALALTLWAGGALAEDAVRPSDTQLPVTASTNPVPGDSDIKTRLDAAGAPPLAGEPVHAALLRKFYAGYNNAP